MSSGDRRETPPGAGDVKNGVASEDSSQRQSQLVTVVVAPSQNQRLRLNPSKDHKPESYEDLQLDFSPSIFSSLERYLPPTMLAVNRDEKVKFMREILLKYLPHGERTRVCFCYICQNFIFLFPRLLRRKSYGKKIYKSCKNILFREFEA